MIDTAYRVVPLTNDPNQIFSVRLPVDDRNITLILRLRYNTVARYWVLGISDENDNALIAGLPLMANQYPCANLLRPWRYLRIGSLYLLASGKDATGVPTDTDLATEYTLIWGDTPDE